MKTAELTGAALDWAVAECERSGAFKSGEFFVANYTKAGGADSVRRVIHTEDYGGKWMRQSRHYSPSTDWAQGGPIIERENIAVRPFDDSDLPSEWGARDELLGVTHWTYGPTPLIAAMRCYVASKLGDEVEIPKELI